MKFPEHCWPGLRPAATAPYTMSQQHPHRNARSRNVGTRAPKSTNSKPLESEKWSHDLCKGTINPLLMVGGLVMQNCHIFSWLGYRDSSEYLQVNKFLTRIQVLQEMTSPVQMRTCLNGRLQSHFWLQAPRL